MALLTPVTNIIKTAAVDAVGGAISSGIDSIVSSTTTKLGNSLSSAFNTTDSKGNTTASTSGQASFLSANAMNSLTVPIAFNYKDSARIYIQDGGDSSGMLQIIVTEYNETHEEEFATHNVVSDTFNIYAYGAKPVVVSLKGYTLVTDTADHFLTTLQRYSDKWRLKNLVNSNSAVTLVVQDTTMSIGIERIHVEISAAFETFYIVTLSGFAWDYKTTNIKGSSYLTYSGTLGKVPTKAESDDKDANKKDSDKKESDKKESDKNSEDNKKTNEKESGSDNKPSSEEKSTQSAASVEEK